MTAERVVVTRTEIRQLREHAEQILALVDVILQRPEPESRGWIAFSDAVIELPDSPDEDGAQS